METIENFRLMSDAEADSIMAEHFNELAAEEVAPRDIHAKPLNNERTAPIEKLPKEETEESSPWAKEVRTKLLAVMGRPRGATAPTFVTPAVSVVHHGTPATKSDTGEEDDLLRLCDDIIAGEFADATVPVKTKPVPLTLVSSSTVTKTSASHTAAFAAKTPTGGVTSKHGEFPIANISGVWDYENPLGAMTELCRQLLVHKDYDRVRDEYCNLSIRMNLMGKLAPGFRSPVKFGAKLGDPSHMTIHRDKIVIDLHWCHATRMPAEPGELALRSLFEADAPFPFDVAWSVANEKWKGKYRADEALRLTTFQQCQLACVHNEDIAARLKSLHKGVRSPAGRTPSEISFMSRKIGQWAEQHKNRQPHRQEYVQLWLVRALLGHDASIGQIAKLHALMTGGEVRHPKTIRGKLKTIDKLLITV